MITKETKISELLMQKPEAGVVLQGIGMHCLGCAIASMETIEEAADVHGVDVDELLKKINEA